MALRDRPWDMKPTLTAGVMQVAGCGFECDVTQEQGADWYRIVHLLNGQVVTFRSDRPQGVSIERVIDEWTQDLHDQTVSALAPLHETRWE